MRKLFRRRTTQIAAGLIAVCVLLVVGYGIYLANLAGELPWQSQPTRIPITPFAGIPGFSEPGVSLTPTPAKATPAAEQAAPADHIVFVVGEDRFAQAVRSGG